MSSMEDSPLTPTKDSEVCTPLLYVLSDRVETAFGEPHLSKQQVCIVYTATTYNAQKPDIIILRNLTHLYTGTRLALRRPVSRNYSHYAPSGQRNGGWDVHRSQRGHRWSIQEVIIRRTLLSVFKTISQVNCSFESICVKRAELTRTICTRGRPRERRAMQPGYSSSKPKNRGWNSFLWLNVYTNKAVSKCSTIIIWQQGEHGTQNTHTNAHWPTTGAQYTHTQYTHTHTHMQDNFISFVLYYT